MFKFISHSVAGFYAVFSNKTKFYRAFCQENPANEQNIDSPKQNAADIKSEHPKMTYSQAIEEYFKPSLVQLAGLQILGAGIAGFIYWRSRRNPLRDGVGLIGASILVTPIIGWLTSLIQKRIDLNAGKDPVQLKEDWNVLNNLLTASFFSSGGGFGLSLPGLFINYELAKRDAKEFDAHNCQALAENSAYVSAMVNMIPAIFARSNVWRCSGAFILGISNYYYTKNFWGHIEDIRNGKYTKEECEIMNKAVYKNFMTGAFYWAWGFALFPCLFWLSP